jgi:hypothetical protein
MSLERVEHDWRREFFKVSEKIRSVNAQTEMVER